MADDLEVTVRDWEVEVSLEESEQFKQNIAGILEKIGFVKGEKYWENAELGGLRLYSTNRHTGCGAETLYLSIKSPSVLERIPPVVTLLEQAIQSQKYISLKIKQGFVYA